MEDGLREAAPGVAPMEVGAPLVGLDMEGANDIPAVEALLEAGHMAPAVRGHLEVAHLEVVHLMVVDTAQEAQREEVVSPFLKAN